MGLSRTVVAGPPLLNGRCSSLLRAPVSEMTHTVSSGTLNSSIPYHTGSETYGDFSRKSQNVSHSHVFCAPAELCTGAGIIKLERLAYQAEKEVWRDIQPSGYNTRTWRTDGRPTPADSKTAL